MTSTLPPFPAPPCRILTTASHRPISVYPGLYQSAIGILQNEHPSGLQPDFSEQVQNIE